MSNSLSTKGPLKREATVLGPLNGWGKKSHPPSFTNTRFKLEMYFSFLYFPTSTNVNLIETQSYFTQVTISHAFET
jgi:hypothetical protein